MVKASENRLICLSPTLTSTPKILPLIESGCPKGTTHHSPGPTAARRARESLGTNRPYMRPEGTSQESFFSRHQCVVDHRKALRTRSFAEGMSAPRNSAPFAFSALKKLHRQILPGINSVKWLAFGMPLQGIFRDSSIPRGSLALRAAVGPGLLWGVPSGHEYTELA